MTTIEILRQYRLGGYAIFDVAVSFAGIFLLSPILIKGFKHIGIRSTKKSWMFLTIPIGLIVHVLSGNITPMTQGFLDLKSHFLLKLGVIGLTLIGLKDIKRTTHHI